MESARLCGAEAPVISRSDSYNNRLQPSSLTATVWSTTLLSLSYNFLDGSGYNNGNVVGITNNLDATRSFTFSYDQLNRISTAATSSGSAAYSEDIWGNLYSISLTGSPAWQNGLSLGILTNNRISGDRYDNAGNMTGDGLYSYAYDAEERQTSAAGVTYRYDGDGKRVEKVDGEIYWYGLEGEPLLETDWSGNIQNEYVFLGGQRLARRDASSNVYYYLSDHLGTSRAILTSSGSKCYDADFGPYGKESVYVNGCSQNYKFTGKGRDSETGNDYFGARFDENNLGRFLSPDPGGAKVAVLSNPQTWDMYAYSLNNPLRLVDPSGKFPTDAHIVWTTAGLESIGFSSGVASSFSRMVNTTVDNSFFFADNLHAMSGDASFYSTRSRLLSMAADGSLTASERVVALSLGMHLVEDRLAHIGITGMIQHVFRFFPHADADPNSSAGEMAQEATAKFLADFKGLLVKDLGQQGAQDTIAQLEKAASGLTQNGVFSNVRDIEMALQPSASLPMMGAQPSQMQEDAQRLCAMGNRAACD